MELMGRMKRKRILGNKGFTFVEVVITITIMALLLGVVGTKFTGYLEKGRLAKDEEIFDRFAMAAVEYYSSHLDYFAEVREAKGILAFTVFYVKQYHTPSANDGVYNGTYTNFTGKRTDDLSFGIQKMVGYYMEDDKDPANELWGKNEQTADGRPFIRSSKARAKLLDDLASVEGKGLTEIRIEFNFATRTVHVQAGIGGDNATGDGRDYSFYDKTFSF